MTTWSKRKTERRPTAPRNKISVSVHLNVRVNGHMRNRVIQNANKHTYRRQWGQRWSRSLSDWRESSSISRLTDDSAIK